MTGQQAGGSPQFFNKRQFRTLEAFAEVAIEGHDPKGLDEKITAREIAFNIDRQLARIETDRAGSMRLIMDVIEFGIPLLSGRWRFSRMKPEARKKLIKRYFIKKSRRGLFAVVARNLARVKLLFVTGYYGDDRVLESIGFEKIEDRDKYKNPNRLVEREQKPVAIHVPDKDVIETEVCVIGSGAGGAVAAYHAAATSGRDVILLEAGPYLHGMKQISHDDGEMIAKLYKDGGLQTTMDLHTGIQQGQCLGGSTYVNNAICFRVGDSVLSPQQGPPLLDRWADMGAHIDKARLDESYGRVEERLMVRSLLDTQEEGLPNIDGANPNALIDGWEALKNAGKVPADINYGLFKKNYDKCLGCGSCILACRYKRKLSMVETYIPAAVEAGAKVMVNGRATRIERDGRNVTDVRCRQNGRDLRIRAKKVVVAGGAIGSSVLLMESKLGKNVGSRFSFNANTPLIARFDRTLNSFDGVQMGGYIDGRDYMLESWYHTPFAFSAIVPGWFNEHFKRMEDYARYACAGVLIGTDHNGRVKRSRFFRNALGPVKYTMTKADLVRIKRGMAQLAEVYFAAGAEVVYPTSFVLNLEMKRADFADKPEKITAFLDDHIRRPTDLNLNSAHPQGGNPMSDNERVGVVDSQFRVHGLNNLFVCDASVFPTTISINPQLTIMAMADYFGHLGVL